MFSTTRSMSGFSKNEAVSLKYKYAILFPEGAGYLFIKQLPAGCSAAPQLVYSLQNGKTCVRKLTGNLNIDESGFPSEVKVCRSLEKSGFVPKILEHRLHDGQSVIIFEYCDGGDLDNYVKNHIRKEEDAELLMWHVIAQVTRITTYLQTGWIEQEYDQQQDYDELIVLQPGWKPIFHRDLHPGNVFLDFSSSRTDNPVASQPVLPRVLIGDFGYAKYEDDYDYDELETLDLAYLLEGMIANNTVDKCSAEGREELLSALSPYWKERIAPPVAEAFKALVPIAEEKVRSYKTVSLPVPDYPKAPMLFETPAPLLSEGWILAGLSEQQPWKRVKITEENVERGRFSDFEEVSEAELDRALEARRVIM